MELHPPRQPRPAPARSSAPAASLMGSKEVRGVSKRLEMDRAAACALAVSGAMDVMRPMARCP